MATIPSDQGSTIGQPWWLCPNTPRCPHPNVVHDIEDWEDTTPRCCAEDCDCGAKR